MLPPLPTPATPTEEEEARPPKCQASNRQAYCNTLVNLSRPSNVRRQAIQFSRCKGERLSERPVERTDSALFLEAGG